MASRCEILLGCCGEAKDRTCKATTAALYFTGTSGQMREGRNLFYKVTIAALVLAFFEV
jgi:hypothetical protein